MWVARSPSVRLRLRAEDLRRPPARWDNGFEGRSALHLKEHDGDVAQLGEHLLCKQEVTGSIPVVSTTRDCEAGG